ncbi:Eukaryotic translation initiation factor 4 gamma [Grifola frondosa]|uniref:Eukaryotic translation initiation factor 4 gamma n=1 Tax=Grifola frondosa TaxID=5627 RepID=A0A1C7LZF3_GRIFR|nr:Eukaryotic translation initiation factor 4 gamma [Grifola frondosa]
MANSFTGRISPVLRSFFDDIIERTVQGLLNKLTTECFDSISDQIITLVNKSEKEKDGRTLTKVIHLILEKATNDAEQSGIYARLCRKMMEQISMNVQGGRIRDAEGKLITGGRLFCKYLLNRCQEDFERRWVAKEATATRDTTHENTDGKSVLCSNEYYAAQKARRQSLGLIKFIGELFKVQMLTERNMHERIKELLAHVEDPPEENIESLCTLLTIVGQILDTPKARTHMDMYFSRMKELCKSPDDVIELRDRKWVSYNLDAASTTATVCDGDEVSTSNSSMSDEGSFEIESRSVTAYAPKVSFRLPQKLSCGGDTSSAPLPGVDPTNISQSSSSISSTATASPAPSDILPPSNLSTSLPPYVKKPVAMPHPISVPGWPGHYYSSYTNTPASPPAQSPQLRSAGVPAVASAIPHTGPPPPIKSTVHTQTTDLGSVSLLHSMSSSTTSARRRLALPNSSASTCIPQDISMKDAATLMFGREELKKPAPVMSPIVKVRHVGFEMKTSEVEMEQLAEENERLKEVDKERLWKDERVWKEAANENSHKQRPPPNAGDFSNFGKISKMAAMTFGPRSIFAGKKETKRESRGSMNMFSMLSQNPELVEYAASSNSSRPLRHKASIDLGQSDVPEASAQQRKPNLPTETVFQSDEARLMRRLLSQR